MTGYNENICIMIGLLFYLSFVIIIYIVLIVCVVFACCVFFTHCLWEPDGPHIMLMGMIDFSFQWVQFGVYIEFDNLSILSKGSKPVDTNIYFCPNQHVQFI